MTLARDTIAAYSLPTDRKRRKLQTEWSSLESIHQLLRVLMKRVLISSKKYCFSIHAALEKVLIDVYMIDPTANSMRLKLSMLDAYG